MDKRTQRYEDRDQLERDVEVLSHYAMCGCTSALPRSEG